MFGTWSFVGARTGACCRGGNDGGYAADVLMAASSLCGGMLANG